jgi:glyoxylase-like metal-dependent hydrolase (beta-lactamase superfamily II)
MTASASFVEVARGVHVLRYPVLDVNVTLVVGSAAALVVDTLATPAQARDLMVAIRSVTALPLNVVNTHAHFDHCFGNATLAEASPGLTISAHTATLEAFRDAAALRRGAAEEARSLAPSIADEVAAALLRAPDSAVARESIVDLGDRSVVLLHFGRGHTAGDLVVHVPDASVVVAGDLVEEGAPPSFSDSYPLDWPDTLTAVLALQPSVVIPGHGAVVDAAFVHDQRAELSRLEWLIRDGDRVGAPAEAVAGSAPFGYDAAVVAVRRGYALLSGAV